jgi:hypothetical protein
VACKGTCTVRIFDSRNLKAQRWPDPMNEEIARRYLQGVVDKKTQERKESGCESEGCECVPLADYLPDAAGKRKKAPDWSAWRLRNVIDKVGSDDHPEYVFGTVETRSAIVPGLCEENAYAELVSLTVPLGGIADVSHARVRARRPSGRKK